MPRERSINAGLAKGAGLLTRNNTWTRPQHFNGGLTAGYVKTNTISPNGSPANMDLQLGSGGAIGTVQGGDGFFRKVHIDPAGASPGLGSINNTSGLIIAETSGGGGTVEATYYHPMVVGYAKSAAGTARVTGACGTPSALVVGFASESGSSSTSVELGYGAYGTVGCASMDNSDFLLEARGSLAASRGDDFSDIHIVGNAVLAGVNAQHSDVYMNANGASVSVNAISAGSVTHDLSFTGDGSSSTVSISDGQSQTTIAASADGGFMAAYINPIAAETVTLTQSGAGSSWQGRINRGTSTVSGTGAGWMGFHQRGAVVLSGDGAIAGGRLTGNGSTIDLVENGAQFRGNCQGGGAIYVDGIGAAFQGHNTVGTTSITGDGAFFAGATLGGTATMAGDGSLFSGAHSGGTATISGYGSSFMGLHSSGTATTSGDGSSFSGVHSGGTATTSGDGSSFSGVHSGGTSTLSGDGSGFDGVNADGAATLSAAGSTFEGAMGKGLAPDGVLSPYIDQRTDATAIVSGIGASFIGHVQGGYAYVDGKGAMGGGLVDQLTTTPFTQRSMSVTGDGNFAWGSTDETGNIQATGSVNCFQFGIGTNAVANCFQLGDGISIYTKAITGGTPTGVKNGMLWLDTSGYMYKYDNAGKSAL